MIYLVILGIIIALYISPTFRCAVFNPIGITYYTPIDIYNYFKYKIYNNPDDCKLICYQGTFGKGKTLSAVHYIVGQYKRYNNIQVWDSERGKFVTQLVKVVSNVELNIPYEKLKSLEQIVKITDSINNVDNENNTLTRTYVLLDEASVELNSREFKKNINPKFLSSLLTARHYHFGTFVYTSQRFHLVDKLLRDVTTYVYDCNKLWRFQRLNIYNAWEMENATDVTILQPLRKTCWFVKNKDYASYNTYAVVEELKKDFNSGNMMTDEEILNLQVSNISNDNVINTSKKYDRKKKKHNRKWF